jgi:hypothetical protein
LMQRFAGHNDSPVTAKVMHTAKPVTSTTGA